MSVSANLRNRLKYALANSGAADELTSALGFVTFGNVYYVDPTNGSDTLHDGLSTDSAFATISKAYSLVTSGNHDVIVLSANAAHSITSALSFTKSRFHIVSAEPSWGLRRMGQRARITSSLSTGTHVAPITITGVGVTLHGLKITSSDTAASSLYAVADGGEFTVLDHCWLEKDSDLDQTGAAELLCNGDTPTYVGCTFGNCIYTTSVARQNVLCTRETISGKAARDVVFEDCLFQNKTSATTVVNVRATTTDIERFCLFKDCVFWSAKLSSATQAVVFGIASALTEGQVLLKDCVVQNITDVCATGLGVFTNSVTPVADGTESISVATT